MAKKDKKARKGKGAAVAGTLVDALHPVPGESAAAGGPGASEDAKGRKGKAAKVAKPGKQPKPGKGEKRKKAKGGKKEKASKKKRPATQLDIEIVEAGTGFDLVAALQAAADDTRPAASPATGEADAGAGPAPGAAAAAAPETAPAAGHAEPTAADGPRPRLRGVRDAAAGSAQKPAPKRRTRKAGPVTVTKMPGRQEVEEQFDDLDRSELVVLLKQAQEVRKRLVEENDRLQREVDHLNKSLSDAAEKVTRHAKEANDLKGVNARLQTDLVKLQTLIARHGNGGEGA